MILKTKEVTNIEVQVKDKDHNEYDMIINVKLVDINGNKILYSCRDITEYKKALKRVELLEPLLSICSICKKIPMKATDMKDPKNWVPFEDYFSKKKSIEFSHGFCPTCAQILKKKLDLKPPRK